MNQTLLLWLYAIGLAAVYMLIYAVLVWFSRRALFTKGKATRRKDIVEIKADAKELEFDLRLALAANAWRRADIVVNIPKNAAERDDMIDTVRMMRRRHKNIFYCLEERGE